MFIICPASSLTLYVAQGATNLLDIVARGGGDSAKLERASERTLIAFGQSSRVEELESAKHAKHDSAPVYKQRRARD